MFALRHCEAGKPALRPFLRVRNLFAKKKSPRSQEQGLSLFIYRPSFSQEGNSWVKVS